MNLMEFLISPSFSKFIFISASIGFGCVACGIFIAAFAGLFRDRTGSVVGIMIFYAGIGFYTLTALMLVVVIADVGILWIKFICT